MHAPGQRRFPIGAERAGDGGVHFRVWAPDRMKVELICGGRSQSLRSEQNGYFSALVDGIGPGARYRYRLEGEGPFPDPASRYQPEGPHGPSEVIDPGSFHWTDGSWRGLRPEDQVLYELHVGTFTREGTWAAAQGQLQRLADLGITAIEMMPVADFAGTFGWGYDGVDLFAPTRLYGRPDDLRRFLDQAHALGLGVILDVVYNHLGPDGNYLTKYSKSYFTDRYVNEWGEAIDFDGPDSGPVREFFIANAAYWIDEFHMDGLRLDATQQIFDASEDHILAALARRVREASGDRSLLLVAENESQHPKLVRSERQGGYGLDLVWNDDFHHTAHVAATGKAEAYYTDYRGTPQELISSTKRGYLYQGQRYSWQKKRRGLPAWDLRPHAFVAYLQNHDQVANSADGRRVHELSSPGVHRALTALLLLGPHTPLLFQGQEFGAPSPFLYFCDHRPDLAALVRSGRAGFLAQFPSIAAPETRARLADPGDRSTFERCKLDPTKGDPRALALHADLLRLRREDPTFSALGARGFEGAVLGADAFVLRWFGERGEDRLLLVNLGADLPLSPAPEPLLAPREGGRWRTLWSSEDPRYGGSGTSRVEDEGGGFRLPGRAAVVLAPEGGS